MRAAVVDRYGPPEVVRLVEVPTPVAKDNEILVRVRATTVTSADWRVRSLDLPAGFRPMGRLMLGLFRPRRPIRGTGLAGTIAAGGVGSAVVQLARHFGAGPITAVASTPNLDLVRSLGADRVIDYTREDFTSDGRKYDVIVDTAGTATYARVKGSLTERGRLFAVLGRFG